MGTKGPLDWTAEEVMKAHGDAEIAREILNLGLSAYGDNLQVFLAKTHAIDVIADMEVAHGLERGRMEVKRDSETNEIIAVRMRFRLEGEMMDRLTRRMATLQPGVVMEGAGQ